MLTFWMWKAPAAPADNILLTPIEINPKGFMGGVSIGTFRKALSSSAWKE